MQLRSNRDSIPIVVMIENIHLNHTMNFFLFTAPVISKNSKKELDVSKYNPSYLKNVILL